MKCEIYRSLQEQKPLTLKLSAGGYRTPVDVSFAESRMFFAFGFNRALLNEIKNLEGRKWHGFDEQNPRKVWSAPITPRNLFTLSYLARDPKNPLGPYANWKATYPVDKFSRDLGDHQAELATNWYRKRAVIAAYEMGTGKTLPTLTVIERVLAEHNWHPSQVMWVGTKSSVDSTLIEIWKWGFKLDEMNIITYDRLRILWESASLGVMPRIFVLDECSRVKNPNAKRSQAAQHVADAMRFAYDDHWIIGLTGSPAPKAPTDWWKQAEIICPGYLAEPDVGALTRRLGVVEMQESEAGSAFPKLKAWRDSENICSHVTVTDLGPDSDGKPQTHSTYCCAPKEAHSTNLLMPNGIDHAFKPSVNEVAKLYKRLGGLVYVKMAKDCLSLPDMRQDFVILKPSQTTLQLARLIASSSPRVVTTLAKLAELSDGFQYKDSPTGETVVCADCNGTRKITTMRTDDFGNPIQDDIVVQECCNCNENGMVEVLNREPKYLGSPKEAALVNDLELNEEVGRLVVYAEYTATIDRIKDLCLEQGWGVMRFDGRGAALYMPTGEQVSLPRVEILKLFMQKSDMKFVFVGQPVAAGMGINLTAARTLIWYGLPFNGESYIQARKRIHRWGMDVSRGVTEKFYFHLGTDKMRYDNLTGKLSLQALTLGDVTAALADGGAK